MSVGTFLGKFAFGSVGSSPQYYLTTATVGERILPEMSTTTLSPTERCIVYASDGKVVIVLANLDYLMLLPNNLGWIVATTQRAQASPITITAAGNRQTWQVVSNGSLATIGYTLGDNPTLLTINYNSATSFEPITITPPLSSILAAKNGAGMDFTNVDLSGCDLAGVDFTKAQFDGATLSQTLFTGCTLSGASFTGASLSGTSFDGATLDGADFSGATTATNVSQVKWGTPKSAVGIKLNGTQAQGSQLGASGTAVNCTNANLGAANFACATLAKLNLTGANLAGTILAGSNCSGATFDGSTLTAAVAVSANFTGASFQGATGHGAVFVAADLTNANLARSLFGAKALLFTMSEGLVAELGANKYVTTDIISAFLGGGFALSNDAAINVVQAGQSWTITDPTAGVYDVINNSGATALNVYQQGASTPPAIFTGATMFNTTASGGSFSAADFTGAAWYGNASTADHTDLTSAVFTGALLLENTFTQAQIFGTNFAGSVLIQSKLRGCTIGPNAENRATSFAGARLEGADLTGTTLSGVLLVGAAVALPQGVPLFVMPSSYASDLTAQGLPAIGAYFLTRGYALGASAAIARIEAWVIDNSSESAPGQVTTFLVRNTGGQTLPVFDASSTTFLFSLSSSLRQFLNFATAQQPLIRAFANQQQALSATAAINSTQYWQITNSSDVSGSIAYGYFSIYSQTDGLHVYGATLVWLRDFPQLSGGAAFSGTINVGGALNPQSLAPNGYPWSSLGSPFTLEQMLTSISL